jgi:hypothetical protein
VKRAADPRRALILMFLAIIAGVPASQALVELCRGGRPRVLDLFDRCPTAPNLRAYERDLEGASLVARSARPWVQFAQHRWLRDAGEKALVGRHGWLFYKPGVEYLLDPARDAGHAKPLNDPLPAIVAFRDSLRERGIRLLLVPVPDKASVYPEHLTARVTSADVLVCPSTRRLFSRLSAEGLEFVDLFDAFSAEKRGGSRAGHVPLYLAQDTHWSPAGIEIAARVVARRILDRGWIAAGPVAFESRPTPVARLGDVLRMLGSPPIERRSHLERVVCGRVVRRDTGEPYRGEGDGEVLVLGDSFLRIFEEDEPGSAGFLSHLALELRRPLLSLASDGGAATLVRRELYHRPRLLRDTKVLVWEFAERDIGLALDGWRLVRLPSAEAQRRPSTATQAGPTSPGKEDRTLPTEPPRPRRDATQVRFQ